MGQTLSSPILALRMQTAQQGNTLNFDNAKLSDEDGVVLAGHLSDGDWKHVENLYLKENDIGVNGAVALGAALEKGATPNLKEIRMFRNPIGPQGTQALAAALGKGATPQLTYLGLRDAQCGAEGMEALAAALLTGSTPDMSVLGLSDNEAGDAGVERLGEVIAQGFLRNLTELHLNTNKIGEKGATALATALFKAAETAPLSLKLFRMSNNAFGENADVVKMLVGALAKSAPNLSTLELDGEPGVVYADEKLPDEVLQAGWMAVVEHLRKQ